MLALGLFSCTNENQTHSATPTNTVLIGRVKAVAPLPSRVTAKLNRWILSIQVEHIIQGSPPIHIGDNATIQVHSIARTFFSDPTDIVGRHYRLTYNDLFTRDYDGDISAIATTETDTH